MEKLYTAGELAGWAGVSARTIRFYEEKGLLRPKERSTGGYRLYDDSAIVRLQEILMMKYVGLPLEEISRALEQGRYACGRAADTSTGTCTGGAPPPGPDSGGDRPGRTALPAGAVSHIPFCGDSCSC